ncbi:MAG: hypothetical protein KDA85_20960, partial [Planctomycetaceae bacterium]|nr:hypothetical protein [Planctomycetaceae bacterium]
VEDLGTSVPISSWPTPTAPGQNVLVDAGFLHGITGWSASPAGRVYPMSSYGVGGSGCLLVYNRTSFSDAATIDVSSAVRSGQDLSFSAWVLPLETNCEFRVRLQVITTDGTVHNAADWTSSEVNDGWFGSSLHRISTTLEPQWNGIVRSATLQIRTRGSGTAGDQAFLLDGVSLAVSTAPEAPALYRQVISPTVHPLSAAANASGVYVIDCEGQNVEIRDCRIIGTLVLKNAGRVTLSGSLAWAPAVPGLPALVTDGPLKIQTNGFALSEFELGVNLNPSGAPDSSGQVDSTFDDAYASQLNGMLYVADDAVIDGIVRVDGILLVTGDLQITGLVDLQTTPEQFLTPSAFTHDQNVLLRLESGTRRRFN